MEREEYAKMYELEDSYWWFVGKRRIAQTLLQTCLPEAARRQILDVGCGTGATLQLLLANYGMSYGLDLSESALDFCRQRALARLTQGSALTLPYADCSFDLVTAFDLLYHRWVEDDGLALRECARVLRPEGILLITDSAFRFLWSEHDVAYHAKRRYTKGELRAKVEGAGLRVRKLSYANTFFFPAVLAVRMWKRIHPSAGGAHSDLRPLPAWLNRLLATVYSVEAWFLRWINYPVGVSVVCVAEKR